MRMDSDELQRYLKVCGGLGQRIAPLSKEQRDFVFKTLTPPGKNFMSGHAPYDPNPDVPFPPV